MRYDLPQELLQRSIDYGARKPWMIGRFPFLGASELAGALGLSKFASNTPFGVWSNHTGDPPTGEEDADQWEAFRWGHRLEDDILEEFILKHQELGDIIVPMQTPPFRITAHPVYPLIRGTPDGLIWDHAGNLVAGWDAKNVGVYRKSEFTDDDSLPVDIVIQGTAYCEIFEVPVWYFSVLIGGNEYREFKVERDTDFAESIITSALEWWHDYVVSEPPQHPPVDGSKSAKDLLLAMYGDPREVYLQPTAEAIMIADRLEAVRSERKASKDEEGLLAQQLMDIAKDTWGMEGVFTWKPNKGTVKVNYEGCFIALAQITEALPEDVDFLIKTHMTTGPGARPVRVTKAPKTNKRGNWK